MHQIPPHLLWIGHSGDGRELRTIFDQGIQARVELAAEEALAPAPHDLITCRFPLVDGNGNDPAMLRMALRTVAHLLREKVPTLVCCGAGLSRSPAVVAGAIALLTGERPEDCLVRVLLHRPADLVPGLWHEVAIAVSPMQPEFVKR
jgi:protein-tyrosine phosphatase